MSINITLTWRRLFGAIGVAALLGLGVALLVAWSGLYNVAASRGHPAWLNWFLELGMRNSVEANAPRLTPPDLEDPELIALGAAHFQTGCAPCHGGPDQAVNPIYQGMLPEPPKLGEAVDHWSDSELHWIIKHGLQYAGMPGWAAPHRDDEIWALVAFLRALPELTETEFRSLAAGNGSVTPVTVEHLISGRATNLTMTTCTKCHETELAPPVSDRIPRLAGQPRPFLLRALKEYRADARQSGIMEPVAAEIPDALIADVAAYYADLTPPPSSPPNFTGNPERGREIALNGDPDNRVAACQACHSSAAKPEYPRLAGQSASYMTARLKHWKTGHTNETPLAALMANAMGKLSDEQIDDVVAWYASRPTGGEAP